MASPMTESRIEPHKKAHFSLHISDRIANGDAPRGGYSSVKYNHKPAQTSESRTTTLTSASPNKYNLRVEDKSSSGNKDIFTFTGNRAATKKSYVLLFDPTSQKATLEPLSDAYTFNLATRNKKDVSSEYAKIYPKKSKEEQQQDEGDDDLFGQADGDDESGDPDASNPYDFRHFLSKEKEKRGDESEYYNASSPDNRAGTGSAMNTPQFGARKPPEAAPAKPKPAEPVPKKRKTAESGMFMKKKPGVKKAQPPPSINLERRASERLVPDAAPKPRAKPAGPPASKIKSAELVHSSDESDADAEGEPEPISSPPRQAQRSPSPRYQPVSDEDADGDSDSDGGVLEIEVPDARSSRPRNGGGALKSLGYGQNLGVGGGFRSPSNGPISLASATNSAQGSPNPNAYNNRAQDDTVIDFGELESDEEEDDDGDGELEIDEGDQDGDGDGDVDEMDIGPPARKASVAAPPADEDEEDPLYQEMMAGLADGDSSEESEEE
ncbi:hypothetical protein HBH56_152470 [Parastagonospora nodorum]|uniref:Transcription elongation factor Eaf N-terminal domain-containing protein n=1 Tax=Phaeosphaeria nodorum (strain SN15 / ATCC MYA-4574 / FGSC 10173) TaxID=321614 RepID=A0A7U2HZG5_PHANO|nr:hypothetical protein HBH56_152470 [Parastagonospora nodorum]QRC96089.1 hypothetical protein JI435_057250 [Parastagonospora nodorum SN15]KAH3926612.1 hypothetical protein HBH54_165210 [Parastagonospora nodorum]KAH4134888.1 hypothetical protein HBH45_160160 [Parastagonospora nodorum]KAH4154921.1 hypothetical protein HBH44_140100 [Parastagonospora nodorum]